MITLRRPEAVTPVHRFGVVMIDVDWLYCARLLGFLFCLHIGKNYDIVSLFERNFAMIETADPIILFRMFERMTLTVAVIVVAIILMIGFWKSVQKIDLTQGGTLGITGSFVFSTPVFALLVIVGYAYVSLSHPIKVEAPTQAGAPAQLAQNAGPSQFLGAASGAETAPDGYDLALVQRRVRSLNCLLRDQPASPRLQDDLADIKLGLMAPVWSADWGDPAAFADWAAGKTTSPPNAVARAFFEEEHQLC